MPALTCRHADLAHGDASAAPAGGLATGATGGSNVGTYPITQGALAATGDCTSGTFHQGTLTVDPASLTVAAGNQAVTCGGGVPGRGVHCESLLHKLLARAFTSEEIDRLKRDFGQVRDLARSAYGLALEVLELHGRGFGPVAIALKLEVSRKSVARVIARGQVPPG